MMAVAPVKSQPVDAWATIERWREQVLRAAGYDDVWASVIALQHDIDLHRACEMVERGCDPRLAAEILL